jgi:hypothetical protein
VQAQIAKEFAALAAQGLTVSHRPKADEKPWRVRRSTALAAAAKRIEALIPPAQIRKFAVEQSLSLGFSFYSQVDTQPDGHGSVNFGIHLPGLEWAF